MKHQEDQLEIIVNKVLDKASNYLSTFTRKDLIVCGLITAVSLGFGVNHLEPLAISRHFLANQESINTIKGLERWSRRNTLEIDPESKQKISLLLHATRNNQGLARQLATTDIVEDLIAIMLNTQKTMDRAIQSQGGLDTKEVVVFYINIITGVVGFCTEMLSFILLEFKNVDEIPMDKLITVITNPNIYPLNANLAQSMTGFIEKNAKARMILASYPQVLRAFEQFRTNHIIQIDLAIRYLANSAIQLEDFEEIYGSDQELKNFVLKNKSIWCRIIPRPILSNIYQQFDIGGILLDVAMFTSGYQLKWIRSPVTLALCNQHSFALLSDKIAHSIAYRFANSGFFVIFPALLFSSYYLSLYLLNGRSIKPICFFTLANFITTQYYTFKTQSKATKHLQSPMFKRFIDSVEKKGGETQTPTPTLTTNEIN
ncbi:hypothetical protein DFA_01270 [Cavenderia fasciculata]|uniref:Transmembrane protein n=1 Tax=Cavenderia fasciculata TaxID=261658 RepID=F4PRV2_CACFS|nr:uncharacterized protein DFA_01270 [Cavenderia fasciculata]EGG21388.1 hypothetical protein DFA_01270 [Cavenderia fasciculata]|eukprot:XP_004359238.1 hypothetical protein DFA_01270 [Cavenderia fasciculata]